MNNYIDKADLLTKIKGRPYKGGGTNTVEGLQVTVIHFNLERNPSNILFKNIFFKYLLQMVPKISQNNQNIQ